MRYSGWELNFFDNSKNFRDYQFFLIKKYLKNNLLEVGPGNGIMVDKYISKYFSNIWKNTIHTFGHTPSTLYTLQCTMWLSPLKSCIKEIAM